MLKSPNTPSIITKGSLPPDKEVVPRTRIEGLEAGNDEHYTVTEVDSERLTSWRKGIIFYDNASLDEIVRLIEQTYKVSLMYTRPENDDQRFSGAFLKTQKLETVLQQTNKLTGTNLILIQ
jgi:hypothetical protein